MRFAYLVVINLTTEGTFKCAHCVMTETHAWIPTPHEFLVTNIVGFGAIFNPLCFLFQYNQPPTLLCFLSL